MLVIAALLLIVLGASVRGLRTVDAGPRWPFRAAAAISGGALTCLLLAAVIALSAGRDTWNSWVSGSRSSESVTLGIVLVVGPVVLLVCCALIALGVVLRARRSSHGRAAPR